MEPYNPNKPFISMKLDGSLLDRMVEAGIPFSRALRYFRDNPEGSAFETLKTAAEDVVPFYGNYRHGGGPIDYLTEAALMFSPVKGHRMKVRTMPDGTPNLIDLGQWYDAKLKQMGRVERTIASKDPAVTIQGLEDDLRMHERQANGFLEMVNDPQYPQWQRDKALELAKKEQAEVSKLRNDINQRTMDILDYHGMTYKDYGDKFGIVDDYDTYEPPFIERQIRNEYDNNMSRKDIRKLMTNAWEETFSNTPNELKEMYKDIINNK